MKGKRRLPVAVALAATLVFFGTGFAEAEEGVPRMSVGELKGHLGSPDTVVLDVRFGGGQASSRIAGAVHEDPEDVGSWAEKYPRGKRIVLYCD